MNKIKNTKLELNLFRLIIFLIIFPEIGIFRFPSDTQPYFLIFTIFALILGYKRIKTLDILLVPFALMLVFSTLSFIITIVNSNNFFALFRSYFGYISTFFLLLYLFTYKEFYVANHLNPIFDFCIFFIYLGFFLNLIGLNWTVQLFVNRSEFKLDGIRGLVSFFSEQSNMVSVCFILVFSYIHLNSFNIVRGILLFTAIILSASGQAVIELIFIFFTYYLSIFLLFISNNKIKLKNFRYFLISFSLFFFLIFVLKNFDLNYRAFQIFKNFSIETGLYILGSDYSTTWKVQGIFLAIATILSTPFIFQISSLTETNAFDRLFYYHSAIYQNVFGVSKPKFGDRVYSAFGTWVVDFGIIGLLTYLLFLLLFLKKNVFKKKIDPILLTSIFYVLYTTIFKISLSFPTIILTLFSTYNYIQIKRTDKINESN